MTYKEIYSFENKVLKGFIGSIEEFIKTEAFELDNILKQYEKEFRKVNEGWNNEDRAEAIYLANELLRRNLFQARTSYLGALRTTENSPYFAHIDILHQPSGMLETFYLGKVAYTSKDKEIAITDWRSPVASLYYTYAFPTKNAEYSVVVDKDPVEIEKYVCELVLRRAIDIENKRLVNVFDSGNKFMLSKIEQKAGGLLEDIIETIQLDQDLIIRLPLYNNIIVQGVAGSGKTTLALHRVSYLFYNYARLLKPQNTLFLSSSKTLINYLAKSLPGMGITDINCYSLRDFLLKTLVENGIKVKPRAQIQPIGDLAEFTDKFDNFLDATEVRLLEDLDSSLFDRFALKTYNLKRARSRLTSKSYMEKLDTLSNDLAEMNKELRLYDDPATQYDEARIHGVKKTIKVLKNQLDPAKLYSNFCLYDLSLNHLSALYLLADRLGAISYKDYDLVFVDEAQDFNPLHLRCIKTLSSRNVFNFFGDLNQAIYSKDHIKSWDCISDMYGINKLQQFSLTRSYRSTKSIVSKATDILRAKGITDNLPEPVSRTGEPTIEQRFDRLDSMMATLVDAVKQVRKHRAKSIGIICSSQSQADIVSRHFRAKGMQYFSITEGFDDYSKYGIFIVAPSLVKGLEFDTVFILDAGGGEFADVDEGHFRKFVAMTRAMSSLYIYSLN